MPHKSLRSVIPSTFQCALILLLLSATSAAASTCDNALGLELPAVEIGYSDQDKPATFALDVRQNRWLVVEAQNLGSAVDPEAQRPGVRLLDAQCRELQPHPTLPRLRGRHVHFVSRTGKLFVQVVGNDTAFRVDAWLGDGKGEHTSLVHGAAKNDPDPVPEEPIDEWDELRGETPCGTFRGVERLMDPETQSASFAPWHKNGTDPDPVPEEPIDEWDEMRSGPASEPCTVTPVEVREIQAIGVMGWTRNGSALHTWCPWASQPELLGTLTCARPLQGPGPWNLRPMTQDRPDMVTLELSRDAQLSVAGAHIAAVYDHSGERVPPTDRQWLLGAGSYFVEVHDAQPVYELTVDP